MALDRYAQLTRRRGGSDARHQPESDRPSTMSPQTDSSSSRTSSRLSYPDSNRSMHQATSAADYAPSSVSHTASRAPQAAHQVLRTQHRVIRNYDGVHRLVVAIDYGTTYTGVAYALPTSSSASLPDIRIVQDWGGTMTNQPKIPSVYSYTPSGPAGEHQWGADISPGAVTIEHIKLELDVQPEKIDELKLILQALDGSNDLDIDHYEGSMLLPEYTWKDAEDVMSDYLTKVYMQLKLELDEIQPHLRSKMSVDIVVTVPSEWSYRAKNSTFRAVTNAGFNRKTFKDLGYKTFDEVLMVTEPEAAAIYTARHLKEQRDEEFLDFDDCFILCDAGGGTVDIVCYRVIGLQPTLQLEQLTPTTGRKCGSTYIDLAFKNWLHMILGDSNFQKLEYHDASEQISGHIIRGQEMRDVMRKFEHHKRRFAEGVSSMRIDLPEPLTRLTISDKVFEGVVTITPNDMEEFFDDSVNEILEMVNHQILLAESQGYRIRNLFLVGGYGESGHLQQQLRHSLRLRNITIRRPESLRSWTAVVFGAVMYGIEKDSFKDRISAKPCRMNYCLVLNESHSQQFNDARDRYINPITQQVMARSQMIWILRKGDLLGTGITKEMEQPFSFAFYKRSHRASQLPIYSYAREDDDVPDNFETGKKQLNLVAQLNCDLTHIPLDFFEPRKDVGGSTYYIANMICKIKVSHTTMNVVVHYKNRKICSVQVPNLSGENVATGTWNNARAQNQNSSYEYANQAYPYSDGSRSPMSSQGSPMHTSGVNHGGSRPHRNSLSFFLSKKPR